MGKNAPKLIVCGTGSMEEWCKEFINQNECNVELRGLVPNTEVRKLIADSKALILPTQWYEGFPMSIVEAFSVGTSVIGSALGNTVDLIDNGVTGIKFQHTSVEALKSAIVYMNENPFRVPPSIIKRYSACVNYEMLLKIISYFDESLARFGVCGKHEMTSSSEGLKLGKIVFTDSNNRSGIYELHRSGQ